MASTSFTPSLAQNIRENLVVSIGMLVAVPFILWMIRGMSVVWLAISGIAGAVVVFLYYLCRFLRTAPKSVEISDLGLTVRSRGGGTAEIAWEEISGASLTSNAGLNWKLQGANSSLCLRDDGFSTREWDRISHLIAGKLAPRAIKISSDELGKLFLD